MKKSEIYNPPPLENYHINVSEVTTSFNRHFTTRGNTKIVFSGRYGTGKTYFLKGFFSQKDIASKYLPITISPVNYVVSSNEDIFDLIKIDIIKALYLLGKIDINSSVKKLPTYKVILEYAKKRPLQIVKNVSSYLSKISTIAEVTSKVSESVIQLIGDFEKFETEINKTHFKKEFALGEFYYEFIQSRNSYVENNIISSIISEQLSRLKVKDNRDNVLIIEDLDRLDPAHIFRILNILSAHSVDDSNNKFGFDKVVLVCDLDNIHSIYKHFYGVNTEFQGYISKFYSFEPFYLDNLQAIKMHMGYVLGHRLPSTAMTLLVELVNFFISEREVTLRKVIQTKLVPFEKSIDFVLSTLPHEEWKLLDAARHVQQPEILFNKANLTILPVLRILKCLFGSYEELLKAFVRNGNKGLNISQEAENEMLAVLAFTQHFQNYYTVPKLLVFKAPTYEYPEINILNRVYRIQLKWNRANPYKREESFFNDNRTHLINGPSGSNQKLNAGFLFQNLEQFIKFFLSIKYLND